MLPLLQAGHFLSRQRRIESDAERSCGRDRCHSGGFLLRIMPPSWYPVPACVRHGHSAGGPFLAVAAMTLHRFASLALKSRIDARKRVLTGKSLHRFASLALKSRIDARKRVLTGKSLHRFPSLGLKSRIDAGCSAFLSTRSTTRSCPHLASRGFGSGGKSGC